MPAKRCVTGGSTFSRMNKLLNKGKLVRDKYSGTWFHSSDTVSDGFGRRIAKQYDCFVHDELTQMSEYKKGFNNNKPWVRLGLKES